MNEPEQIELFEIVSSAIKPKVKGEGVVRRAGVVVHNETPADGQEQSDSSGEETK